MLHIEAICRGVLSGDSNYALNQCVLGSRIEYSN